MIINQTLPMKQTCVQLNVFQINNNPFDNSMKLVYANPFKEASTSFNYHCCSTWQHASWRQHGNLQVGVSADEQLMIMIMIWSSDLKCAWSILVSYWGEKLKYIQKRISPFQHLNWRHIIFYDNTSWHKTLPYGKF